MVIERFRKLWQSGDVAALADLYARDAVLDMNLPQWRFQLQGPEAITAQLKGYFDRGPVTVVSWQERSGDFGAVVEEASRWQVEPEELYYRQVHIFVTDADDRISDHVIYCPGEWDRATVERHKAEAPMVRP
jgi:ketosteroid isomerase-like protein